MFSNLNRSQSKSKYWMILKTQYLLLISQNFGLLKSPILILFRFWNTVQIIHIPHSFKLHMGHNQRMSNQSKLGLISSISPTSPGLDWVTITFLTMDWNCNGYISYPKPIHQSSFCNFFRQIAFFSNFRHFEIQISCSGQFDQKFVLNSQFLTAWAGRRSLAHSHFIFNSQFCFKLKNMESSDKNGLVDWPVQ